MAKKKVSFEELLGYIKVIEEMGDNAKIHINETTKKILEPIKQMQKISLDRLTPPMAPIVDEKSVKKPPDSEDEISDNSEGPDSTSTIDYEAIASSSEFQRFIYFLLMGKTHRGTQRNLRRDVTVKMNKFRGSGMGDVINEFKSKVERLRNEKRED